MRTLSSTLTTAQKSLGFDPIWKITLSRTGQSTKTYERDRILDIDHLESPESNVAEVVLNNADGTLTSLNFEHYQMVVSYGCKTSAGSEYSDSAPLRVRAQEDLSGMGLHKFYIKAVGIFDQMGEDKATAEVKLTDGDARTAQSLLTAIAGTTLAAYSTYTGYTVTYDSTDSIITSFQPKDNFNINYNENRRDKWLELLNYTGCKSRAGADGAIHVLTPVVSGTAYNYSYSFNVSGEHTFFAKTVRERFVNPNKVIVQSPPDQGDYTGNATSATSFALDPKVQTVMKRVASNAEASSIATAKISAYELDAERGFLTVPPNAGQEVWDYINVTDSRTGDTRAGNIQYLRRKIHIPISKGDKAVFQTHIAFGKVSQQSIAMAAEGSQTSSSVNFDEIMALLGQIENKVAALYAFMDDFINNEAVLRKVRVRDRIVIPTLITAD